MNSEIEKALEEARLIRAEQVEAWHAMKAAEKAHTEARARFCKLSEKDGSAQAAVLKLIRDPDDPEHREMQDEYLRSFVFKRSA